MIKSRIIKHNDIVKLLNGEIKIKIYTKVKF